jgi:hypothetical protein
MKLLTNISTARVVDEIRRSLDPAGTLDIASPAFSLFADVAKSNLTDILQQHGLENVRSL